MNLLIAISGWSGGGTERYASLLAKAQKKAGYISHLFIEKLDGTSMPTSSDFESITSGGESESDSEKILEDLITIKSIKLIHLNLWTPSRLYINVTTRRNILLVQTYHSTFPDLKLIGFIRFWHPGRAYNQLRFRFGRLVPDIPLICISKTNEDRITRIRGRYFASHISMVYNGIYEKSANELVEVPYNQMGKERRIVWVGTLSPRKNPILAIRAAIQYSIMTKHSVSLEIYGDGVLRATCEQYCKELPRNLSVTFFGHIEPVPFMGSDVCLITSNHEGLPYVAIEALAAGVPIVTTNCGAISEVTNEGGGILVENSKPTLLASAIATICDTPFVNYKVHARATFEKKFRFDQFANKTLEFYYKIGLRKICET